MTLRQFWRRLHLWIGLAAGILFVLLGLTGSAIVYEEEIRHLLHPQRMQAAEDAMAPPSRLLAAAEAALRPASGRVLVLRYPDTDGRPVQTVIEHADGARQTLLIDPVSAAIIGPLPGNTAFTVLRDLHSKLMLQRTGREIVGWLGLVLAISSITGIVLWWPQPRLRAWKQTLQMKWRNMSWQRRSFDLHKVGGAVIAVPMLLIALSGSALTFRETLLPAFGGVAQGRPVIRPVALENAKSLDALVDEALRQIPGARLVFIAPPARAGGATRIRLREPGEIHQNGRSYVLLDAAGSVLDMQRVSDMPTANLVFDQLPYPLHTGYLFGEAGRFIVFVAGILPLLLFVTGLVLWLRRR